MNKNQSTQALEVISARVPTLKEFSVEAIPISIPYEVKVRPLPPEIDKIIKKYLSHY